MQTLKPSQSWAIAQPTAPLAAQQDQDASDAERVAPRVPQPISVIIPTLNEAANIAQILVRLGRTLTEAAILYEVIVVDDHSTDNTVLIAEAIARGWGLPVRVLTKQGQPGKSFSLMEGFAAAQFGVLVMIDGDLQYPPEALPAMERQLAYADMIVADRRASYSDADRTRGGLSQIFTSVVAILFGIDTDMQSGLKMFRRKIYDGVVARPGPWSLDLYLITHAIANGYKLANVPITFQERRGGVSKVVPFKVGIELMKAALRLKMMQTAGAFLKKAARRRTRELLPSCHSQTSSLENKKESLSLRVTEGDPRVPTPLYTAPAPTGPSPARTESHKKNTSRPLTAEACAQVASYSAWLAADDKYNDTISYREETNEYVDDAMKTVMIDNREVRTFAPFRYEFSALRTFTFGQTATLSALLLALILGLIFFKLNVVVGMLASVTTFYIGDLFLTLCLSAFSLARSGEEEIDDAVVKALDETNWPRYTVLCPLYHEAAVVPQFVEAMGALDYPTDRLQVLFLTEENDNETRDAIRSMSLPGHFKIVTVPPGEPRTKPRACNYGLLWATGDYVVIYDAEDIPDPLQLKKAVLTFANNDTNLACVQAKLNFYNTEQNLLTRLFTAEYSAWFDLTLPGLQKAGLALPLGGTSNHFRTETLGMLGAWDAFNVTEDCDLGLRLAHYGLKTAILDSTTYEEANSQWKNWLRQRSRWIKGYMQTYLVHMRHPLRYLHPSRMRDFFSLQLLIGGKAAVLLINPFMWALLLIYLFFRPLLVGVYHTLFPVSILYMGSLCLIFGNFLYLYIHLMGCLKRGQFKLIKWTLLMPIYWAVSSIAAFIALYQLITKPHYWEKTTHGLHLMKSPLTGTGASISQEGNQLANETHPAMSQEMKA